MCQGLRVLVAALAAVLLLPGVRAGEPQPTIQCKICVVRVTDDGYAVMRTASMCGPKCCAACPSCPTCSHTPCEQKTASTSSCDQACCRQKCGSEECCENRQHDLIIVPPTMPCLIESCMVERLLEIAKDRAGCEVIAAPRVSALPGQTAAVRCGQDQLFVTNVERTTVHGCEAFVPKQESFSTGFFVKLTGSFTADRASIMLNVDAQMTDLDANPPLFPVLTTITPTFEGGAQGQPIPFTQFIQQPSFTTRGVHKIAACPIGKTVVLDCGRRTTTAEVEDAVPFLSEIPLIGDLFRSTTTETVNDHLLVFVTPTVMAAEAGEESSVETTAEAALPLFAMPVMCEEGRVTPVSNVEYLPNAPRPITPPVPSQICPTHCCPGACPCPQLAPVADSAGPVAGFVFAHPVVTVQPYAVPVSGYVPPCAAQCPACPTQCAQAACPCPTQAPCATACPTCPEHCAQAACPCPSCPTQCGQGAACPCPTQASRACDANSSVLLNMKLVLVSDEFFDRDGAGVWTRFAPTDERGNCIFVCGEDVCRFVADAQAKGCAHVLGEPRLVTQSGRPATFQVGRQVAVKNCDGQDNSRQVGFFAQFNPVVSADKQGVRIGMNFQQSGPCEQKCACPHAAQSQEKKHEANTTVVMPWGQTMVRCENAAGTPGQHLFVLTTPYLIEHLDAAVCAPAPAPTCQAVAVCPPPCVAVAALTAAAPMPCVQPVAATAPACCHNADVQLVHLMIEYHEASRCGDKARARNLAAQCIAIDPTCFSR